MKPWQSSLVAPDATFRQVLEAIDASAAGIALLVDEQRRLVGAVSDGDVRRALIKGAALEDPVAVAANLRPLCAAEGQHPAAILATLRTHSLRQIPVLDAERRVVGLSHIDDFLDIPVRNNSVVVMAGGRGARLAELTKNTPKPMLKVGSRPIIETIVSGISDQGFRHFWLAVNYKADQIEAHFRDGAEMGIQVKYLREQLPLGTCGALGLLPVQNEPVLVTNGDVLTKIDYGQVLDFHLHANTEITVVVRNYRMQVPFGVVNAEGSNVVSIEEKPAHLYTISAGVYVLSPSILDLIHKDIFYDMPSLIADAIGKGLRVRLYRAEGYWMDIGRPRDYAQANAEFGAVFGS